MSFKVQAKTVESNDISKEAGMKYPHLFSEGVIGNVTIRNRTVMVPMVTGMANYDGTPSEQIIDYYEERASNSLGLLITGAKSVAIL